MVDLFIPKQKYFIIDIDGTLSQTEHRDHFLAKKDWKHFYEHMIFDKPYPEFFDYLRRYRMHTLIPIFLTGRPDNYRTHTEKWLARYWCDSWEYPPPLEAPNHVKEAAKYRVYSDKSTLIMRAENDFRPAPIVKKELILSFLDRNNSSVKDVSCAFDDNEECIEMFQELGILAFHVKHPLPKKKN